jgi:hypothetical protein
MSRIFDALKRSEAERWGNDLLAPPESVTELLEAAEGRRIPSVETVATVGTMLPPASTESFTLEGLPTMRPAPPLTRAWCVGRIR